MFSSDFLNSLKNAIIALIAEAIERIIESKINNQRYLNPEEAARYLGLKSVLTLKSFWKYGLSYIKIGKTIRYDREDLDKFMLKFKLDKKGSV